jgi:uncharacterized protein (DUF1015 family)
MFDRLLEIAHLAGREPPAELRVIIGGVRVDQPREVVPRRGVLPSVVMRPGERFPHVVGLRLRGHGVLEHVNRRRRISAGQQLHAALVPVVDVTGRGAYAGVGWLGRALDRTRIPGSVDTISGVLRHAASPAAMVVPCSTGTTYDPAMSADGPPVPHGLTLQPFRALRFAAATDLASLTSPPYDVIDEKERLRLEARSPHNAVRLILPRAGEDGSGRAVDPYESAAAMLRSWQESGVLTRDASPGLYVYEQVGDGHVQRGLLGGVGLARPEAEIILPHEDTMAGPVADRLNLLRATATDLEPIFLVYAGGGAATELLHDVAAREPLVDVVTDDGIRHRLWAETDQGRLTAVASDLAPRRATIADGHHRYATYLQYQQERHEAGDGDGPWDFGLAFLVDTSVFGPEVHAIHRVVPGLPLSVAREHAKDGFRITDVDAGADLLEVLAAAGRNGPAFVLTDGRASVLLTDPDQVQLDASLPTERSSAWRGLDVAVAHALLIRRLWKLDDREGVVDYVHDLEGARTTARQSGGTALLLNPTPVEAVAAVAVAGDRMPRKSTLFTPKPATGLVIRPVD